MSCIRSTQVISNWLGENSLVESNVFNNYILNKVNCVFRTDNDIRLDIYYKELYEQKLHTSQTMKKFSKATTTVSKATNVEMVQLPEKHLPYHPTLLPKAPNAPSQPRSVCKAKGKDIPHSAKAPHVDMPDGFLLGP